MLRIARQRSCGANPTNLDADNCDSTIRTLSNIYERTPTIGRRVNDHQTVIRIVLTRCSHNQANERIDANDANEQKCGFRSGNTKSPEWRVLLKEARDDCKTSIPGSNPGGASNQIR